jgi:hypothetical protein
LAANRAVDKVPISSNPRPKKASELTIGSWRIAAQLSTSHSFRDSLDPLGMVETVRRVQEEIDLDLSNR